MDPKSPMGENSIILHPSCAILFRNRRIKNYHVKLVHTVLSPFGSAFGSDRSAIPTKSEFWKLLKPFYFLSIYTFHCRLTSRQSTARRYLTIRKNKKRNPLLRLSYGTILPACSQAPPTGIQFPVENPPSIKNAALFWKAVQHFDSGKSVESHTENRS